MDIFKKDISIGIDCNSNQNDTGCFKSEAEVVGHCYSYSGCQKKKKKKQTLQIPLNHLRLAAEASQCPNYAKIL